MRVLVQRVTSASVEVEGREVASIGHGLLLLIGIASGDGEEQLRWMAGKIAGLRIFEDDKEKFNLSLSDVGGEALAVSQFTLYADTRKGKRPSFTRAAPPETAEPLCNRFTDFLREQGINVAEGVFRAHMQVKLVNDGPVTILIERLPAP